MKLPALLVMFGSVVAGCGDGTLIVDDDAQAIAGAQTNGNVDTGATTGQMTSNDSTPATTTTTPVTNGTNGTTTSPNNTVAQTNGVPDTNNVGATNSMTTGTQYHPMFVAVADFMREKCVACHDMGQNGNLVVPSATVTEGELRMNLEDVVATTGRKIVEPNNPAESQMYIMITNAAGEQFPPATIAIVEDWINAGAPYEL